MQALNKVMACETQVGEILGCFGECRNVGKEAQTIGAREVEIGAKAQLGASIGCAMVGMSMAQLEDALARNNKVLKKELKEERVAF